MESYRVIIPNEILSDKRKELYLSPQAEILEVKVEKGFAASQVGNGGSGTGDWGSGTW
jgi:hypothetical protein